MVICFKFLKNKFLVIRIFFGVLFLFAGNLSTAQKVKYSNDFLTIGVGARNMALANSSAATITSAGVAYWNPACLRNVPGKNSAEIMHASYFAGMAQYDFGAYARKLTDSSVIGVSVIRLGIDNIANTLDLVDASGNIDYSKISYFSAADYAFTGSYAKSLKKYNMVCGVNAKIIYRQIGDFANASGFGFDVGFTGVYKKINWSVAVKDITGTFNAWIMNTQQFDSIFTGTQNKLPENSIETTLPSANVSVSKSFVFSQKSTVVTSAAMFMYFDGKRNTLIKSDFVSISPAFSVEYQYKNIAFFRLGVRDIFKNKDTKKWNLVPCGGVGVRYKNLTLDYALTNIGDKSGYLYSNIFSAGLFF